MVPDAIGILENVEVAHFDDPSVPVQPSESPEPAAKSSPAEKSE
jgi:hypothetical protein